MTFLSNKPIAPRLFAAVVFLSLVGCGGGSEDNQSSREKELEDYASSVGLDVDVELSEDGEDKIVRINSMGAGNSVIGNNLDLPDGFPGDVVMYPGAKIQSSNQILGGFMLTAQSEDNVEDISAYFTKTLTNQGWELGPDGPQMQQMKTLHFTKDDRLTNITLIPTGEKVSVQLNTMPNPG